MDVARHVALRAEPIDERFMEAEQRIQALRECGDLRAAAGLAVETYGAEVYGFLAMTCGRVAADEAFSQACEDLWRGMAGFFGRSTVRTWFYCIARHAAVRVRRAELRRASRRGTLSRIDGLVAEPRSSTQPHLRSALRDRLAQLRDRLPERDRALLALRVDRSLSWTEVARIMIDAELTGPALERASARLRKRFQGVKELLREEARKEGLLQSPDP